MRVVITGGHHNSALVVADLLKQKGDQVFWLGHKRTMWREKSLSAEYLEVSKKGYKFFELRTGKFYKTYNPFQYLKIIYGLFQAFYLLKKINPNLILCFGGYLAVPVALAGFILGVPVITHEQTTETGLANQIIKHFARKIFLAWPSSAKYFPKEKTEVVGLPLRKSLFKADIKNYFKNKRKTIFVIGGKQGCHIINKLIGELLAALLKKYNLIHQVGRIKKTGDLKRLSLLKKELNQDLQKHYILKPYFFENDIAKAFASADMVISRAGAHIIYELAALGKPAILIPIPWSYKNEQVCNANVLKEAGIAEVLSQDDLTSKKLENKILKSLNKLEGYKKNTLKLKKSIKYNAAEKIVNYIKKEI